MNAWSHPQTIGDWLKGMVALRPVVLVLLLSLGLIAELRFDWAEHLVGRYIVTTNPFRPESGAIWEKGHRTEDARQILEKIVTDKQAVQREAREAQNFTQVAQTLSRGIELILSADHFRQLYNALPPELAAEFTRRMAGKLPHGWCKHADASIAEINGEAADMATRKASLRALNAYAPFLPEMAGGSADLTGSNLTKHDNSTPISGDDAAGNYVWFGVREFGMTAICNGLRLHGAAP